MILLQSRIQVNNFCSYALINSKRNLAFSGESPFRTPDIEDKNC